MLLGLIMVIRDWKREGLQKVHMDLLLMFGFMVIYTGIHILSWTLVRYRLPVDAVALIFAGLAFEKILVRLGVLKKLTRPSDENLLRYTVHS